MKRLMISVLLVGALGAPAQAQADPFQACTPPQHMNNFGIPIAATPSLWVNPSDGCINYPPVASPGSNARTAGTPDYASPVASNTATRS
ncbi:hypothetical protein [Candidatus Mycolicibacterium alkanivorans]|uniref:Uncharacterized protein n=1 Tax=Candidatus Mycolicibacterium alkanivorans TaxID=2954114 RepID=A0ABS9YWW0_9MYCO|nr:hypothetical protein [Candidatus Mycolicibacterium alkanivorans]MCI4675731.1 hypothetical protein [Candidatus Mycolicibacterium alkanivorans]